MKKNQIVNNKDNKVIPQKQMIQEENKADIQIQRMDRKVTGETQQILNYKIYLEDKEIVNKVIIASMRKDK